MSNKETGVDADLSASQESGISNPLQRDDDLWALPAVLDTLLRDHTTGRNIFWATHDYEALGPEYGYHSEILPHLITGEHGMVVRPRVLKSKEEQTDRSKDMAEVFTPSWICNAQNNLVDEAWFGRKDVFNIEDTTNHTWGLLVLSLLTAALELVFPVLVRHILDVELPAKDINNIFRMIGILFVLYPYRNYSYDLYEIGAMFRVDYLNTSVENAVASMETYLTVAQEWGIPVQIMNSIYWSSSPYGPDGKGGSFTDPIYTQVTYNSKTGEYYRSTPNVYSDTNWVTAGSDNLNEACADKLSAILGGYSDAIAKARMAGFDTSRMSYVMEWGVCYKAIDTMRGLSAYGKLDAGDFNPGLVEKAAIGGVTLDPTDGLSYAEKLWLTNWTARYNQTLADAWHRGFSSDPVIVNAGKIDLPAAQSLSRLFSHNVQWLNRNPSYDLRISGWKGGVG